jgi:GntR family transcriptional regulator
VRVAGWFDPSNGVPKYRQLQHVLEEMIVGLRPGEPIPPERELEQRFGVSRVTVRQALHQLVLAGRLERVQGKGTFVARPKLEQVLALTSFSEEMIQRGMRPGSRMLGVRSVAAPVYLSAERFPALLEADLTDRSLYAWLGERYGVELAHARQTIEATVLGPEEARLLEMPVGTPAFRLERVSYDRRDRPVEFVRSLYRGDRYKLQARLERPHRPT